MARPRSQGGREHRLGEVDRLVLGNEVEDLRLQHVDAGVDGVGEDLAPRRLLQEPLDPAVGVGDDDAEVERVLHPARGRSWPAPPMPGGP